MPKGIKSYSKGMNQDGTQSKQDQSTYYYASNWRIVTDEGKSTGSLENERGHKLAFNIPNLAQMTLTDGTIIPAQSNLKIIGWATIVDTIVLFTTAEDIKEPLNSYGQIWKLEFDETTGDVIGLSGNNLTVANHLVYNQKVNFSTYNRIGRVVGRYESKEIKRVYWTDFYNPVRVINIADEDSLDIPVDNINLIAGVNYSQPVIQSIGTGNLQTGTEIQFAYRLIDNAGGETLVSPVSALVPLSASNTYGAYNDFKGNTGGKTRSVTYELKALDTDYAVIEHLAIVYTAPNVYKIYKFDEAAVPLSGNLIVTCSNLDDAIEIPLVEFNLLASGFDKAKDIEVKDNRLVVANTITENFDVKEFDSRVYRFNSSQEALLQDANIGNIVVDGVTKNIISGPGTGNSWTTIDVEHDAINPYNKEQNASWFSQQYKYKADGVTIGGEGPNISYEFFTKELAGNFNNGLTGSYPHVTVDNWSTLDADAQITGQLHGDGSTYIIENSGQLKNNAGAWAHSYFRGYARGETYRFAIVFWNKRGTPSFANWIGDIRFPDVSEGFPIQQIIDGSPYVYSLGIRFTVNLDAATKDRINGYSIVRVKREETDKTKLGTGMLMYFDIQDDTYSDSIIHKWEAANDGGLSNNNPWQVTDDTDVFSNLEESNFHLSDKPGFVNPQMSGGSARRVAYLLSPMGQLYSVPFINGDFLKTTGYYRARCVKYYSNDGGGTIDDDKSFGFHYKLLDYGTPSHNREWFEIGKQEIMQTGQYYTSSAPLTSGYTSPNNLMNASYCRDESLRKEVPLGLGSPKMAVMLTGSPSIQHNTGDPASNMNWNSGGDFRGMVFSGNESDDVYFKEVYYCRYVLNQYGGDTFEDRSRNIYIGTNHFQTINTALSSSYTIDVFGGDVFVNYYDDEQIQMYWNQSTAYSQPYKEPIDNKLSVAVCFPCESPCNADFREGASWASNRDGADMGAYESNQYIYNFLWSQENTSENKYFAKDFLIRFTEEHPHQLWASDLKIDGELVDHWRVFRVANRTEVNGIYGPINRIINYKDRLFFYQNSGFGIASMNERSVITDASGQELSLGTGGIFPDYQYLSTLTGSYHQFCVVPTESALYHYDARLKKVFKFTGGPQPLSDIKGMSSWFAKNITGAITNNDFTLRNIDGGPLGVHGEADYRYNRVLFTFLKGTNEKYTISYNELLDAFESFYDYKPGLYLQYGRRLLSVNPFTQSQAYTHNIGEYGKFYNQPHSTSILKTILGDNGNVTKIFDNLEYLSEVYDTNKLDIYTETFNRLRVKNEYQDTGIINLLNKTNIERRMRMWRLYIPRDTTTSTKARIRNPWTEVTLEYDNNADKRFVMHDLIYSYTPAPL